MTLVDDRILEYIQEEGSGSPTEMKREGPIHYSRQQVHRRCKKLTEEGLLEHLGNGIYVITEEGTAYLEGKYDTQNWVYLEDEKQNKSSKEDVGNRGNV